MPVFIPTDTNLRPISSIVPGASVGRLAAGERSVSTVKRLAERRKERSERNQPPNGSVAHLRRPQAGTNARGAKWAQGCQGAITARGTRWFRRGLFKGFAPKKSSLTSKLWPGLTSQSFRRRDPFKFAQKFRIVRLQKTDHFRVLQQFFRVTLHHRQIQHVLPKCFVDCLEILFQ